MTPWARRARRCRTPTTSSTSSRPARSSSRAAAISSTGLKKIDAPVLLITSDDDLIFPPDAVNRTAHMIKSDGTLVEQVKIKGGRGHLDGVYALDQAGARIAEFLGRK